MRHNVAQFIIMGEEGDRFLRERSADLRKDFQENAEVFGLDSKKDYDFVCLSFEPYQQILDEIKEKLLVWPAGPVRGYVNDFGNLCINMPMTPGEEQPEEENIFALLKNAHQIYFDLESANWECYRVSFPEGADSLVDLIDVWNATNEDE